MDHHAALAMGMTPKMPAPFAAGASCDSQVVVPVQVQDRDVEVDGVDLVVLKRRCLVRNTVLIERLLKVDRTCGTAGTRGQLNMEGMMCCCACARTGRLLRGWASSSFKPLAACRVITSPDTPPLQPEGCSSSRSTSSTIQPSGRLPYRPACNCLCLPNTAAHSACLTLFMSSSSNSNVRSGRLTRAFHV